MVICFARKKLVLAVKNLSEGVWFLSPATAADKG